MPKGKTNRTKSLEAIATINQVGDFDPSSLTVEYTSPTGEINKILPVKDRTSWFRLVYPKGTITHELVSSDGKMAVVSATVSDNDGRVLAKALGSAYYAEDVFGMAAIECAATKAQGRALANAGFGTQQGTDLNLPEGIIPEAGVSANRDSDMFNNNDNTEDSDKTDTSFEEKVSVLMNTFSPTMAKGILISYGPAQNQTIKDVYKNEKSEDKLKTLKEYAYPDDTDKDINHVSVVAACRVFINQIEKIEAEKE